MSSAVNVIALIVAAGRGLRTGLAVPKQFAPIAGDALLAHTVDRFLTHPEVDAVRVAIPEEYRAMATTALTGREVGALIAGGDSRQQSVRAGLEAVSREWGSDANPKILIHDGARPFIDAETISHLIAALNDAEGAITARPATDSLHQLSESGEWQASLPRDTIWRAETPQAFHLQSILSVHRNIGTATQFTDDAGLAGTFGRKLRFIPCLSDNLKITHADDFEEAERRLMPNQPARQTRTGQGFDVHRFEKGGAMQLCGVTIPGDWRLKGHSDADVALHAVTDALLSTIGAADIGYHFPPSDPQWRDASSELFVRHALSLLAAENAALLHVGVTLIGEYPRIAPHRPAMTSALQNLLQLPDKAVNVAATTTEKLGFLGRREGLAALATATVSVPA